MMTISCLRARTVSWPLMTRSSAICLGCGSARETIRNVQGHGSRKFAPHSEQDLYTIFIQSGALPSDETFPVTSAAEPKTYRWQYLRIRFRDPQ
ncbi:hypothetical protein F5Y03DRAFT_362211 [Xylaria venustula]|nr:hypothetical protein F5Y03DRAFT_362211 [Xylaria venustula]